ncbi:antitoxin VbhA family protein [Achromobacter seleniivolatilans]|uniref:Antitoxin VbhA family protein n=1 Tax=Achromobacter seleniivolatilans TaxID=3047478 RepID=A0ABY9LV00_9BURK|nr:antitoxin VbhA family protein [Achromobacter sp. R39]WMD18225.1 antitoxin VbhA family protein [Achromobacter sp. R39]
MIADREALARRAAVNSALASQRMEGLEPDAQVIKDAQLWASGEKSLDEAIAEYKARLDSAARKG